MDANVREKYVKAGRIAGRARDYGATLIQEGARLLDVATEVEAFIEKEGGKPAFPVNLSLNSDAAHFTPTVSDPLRFSRGDVVKIDCGVHVDGFVGDTARTIEVGTDAHPDLLNAARTGLEKALAQVRAGGPIRDISAAIEDGVRSHGLVPISNLTGHSVDEFHLHAGLSVPNVAATAYGNVPAGAVLAIEPFATRGSGKVKDGGPGHIWHFQAPRPQRDPTAKKALQYIAEHHAALPFAERWVANAIAENKVAYAMRVLERSGAVRQYPILREATGGLVAQFEHTVVVEADGVTVTTRE